MRRGNPRHGGGDGNRWLNSGIVIYLASGLDRYFDRIDRNTNPFERCLSYLG